MEKNKIILSFMMGEALLLGIPTFAASLQKGDLSNRQELNFDASWKFFLGDDSLASRSSYGDAKWRTLSPMTTKEDGNRRLTKAIFDKQKKQVRMELVSGKYEFLVESQNK